MKQLSFNYQLSGIDREQFETLLHRLMPEIERIEHDRGFEYESDYAFIHLPFDEQTVYEVLHCANEKLDCNPTVLVVIGIGGSHLGAQAIHDALNGTLYNEKDVSPRIYFVDTVDTDYVHEVYQIVERELRQKKNILLNVITKSGTTTETIANFFIFLDLLKEYFPEQYHEHVVVTTDYNSPLWRFADEEQFTMLAIPTNVGGRFSVLSAVGLFPLAIVGIDIQSLLDGARIAVHQSLMDSTSYFDKLKINPAHPERSGAESKDINPAMMQAVLLYVYYQQGIRVHDLFLFDPAFESYGKWYRQLLGESIGKEYDADGNRVNIGITPTVSLGSSDLHSVGQLYLAGPNDRVTTFVSVEIPQEKIRIPQEADCLVGNLGEESLQNVMNAIKAGTERAYEIKERPFWSVMIAEKTPYYFGQLMQIQMMAIVYLGNLFHINPFDQPAVELYKQETRKRLNDE